jgi:hypothetical protein
MSTLQHALPSTPTSDLLKYITIQYPSCVYTLPHIVQNHQKRRPTQGVRLHLSAGDLISPERILQPQLFWVETAITKI